MTQRNVGSSVLDEKEGLEMKISMFAIATLMSVALGASAVAAGLSSNANTGNPARPEVAPSGSGGAGGGSSQLYAIVNADGTTVRGKGNISAARIGTGNYEVIFARNIRACSYVGTIGSGATSGTPPVGLISVIGRAGVNAGVFIVTSDVTGAPADRPFHLYVDC